MAKRRVLSLQEKQLADRLRALRKARYLTQEELSVQLGVSATYIAHVETYERGLSLPMLYRMAKVFGVPIRDLFLPK